MKRSMTDEEQLEIASSIEDYHKVFFTFFEMSDVNFTDEIKTACVRLPKNSKPEMSINEEFWKRLNLRERLFVVCHECLHVILNHGIRNGMEIPGATHRLVNIAQDITINEMIVDLFGYDRNDLRDWKNFCWIDTCFENPLLVKHNETFTYYLELLIKKSPPEESEGGPSIFDDHSNGGSSDNELDNSVIETLAEELTPQELEELLNSLPTGVEAGDMTGMFESIIAKKTQKLKINFKNIVRKLKRSSMKMVEKDVDTFTHEDRRFNEIYRQNASLPGKNGVERPKRDRLLTAIFMDVSGSCLSYIDTFNKVYYAFDEEKNIFDVKLFIFDTRVTEATASKSYRIGGGTRFDIVEDKCLSLERETGKYPDCIVVITDGYGNAVTPKAPTKWIWLLTNSNSTSQYVPSRSRHFKINQITFT